MKRTILIQLVIVCSVISSIAQTNYYEVTKTLVENGYTYQYTYVDQKINATGELVPIGGMKETFEDDNWTKSRCYEIVESSCSNDSVVGI